ncbi:EAL domain-containing protein [Thiomicrorhabdus sp. Kp2]|uniref:bifunctional diguanylate cyclase/phosphodiesterase n=1 Tax=Thiomicrorhabdus sp. Kp2 TaxID=1123518 RepID=UPI0005943B72|nr:EAL domain-containing protein [Thiomicrorhabdus sp. Kp2]
MKRNIWTVYYLILVISIIGLLGLAYAKHSELHQKLYAQQSASLKLITKSIESSLTENELLLDILGSRLLESELYTDTEKTHRLLRKMLATKPNLVGFGLLDIHGNFIAVSGNFDISHLPNLLELSDTKEDFNATLNSNKMVIGRTYFFSGANDWVIPLRKTLRDQNGNPIAVMTTGLKVKDLAKVNGLPQQNELKLAIINARSKYRVYVNDIDESFFQKAYENSITEDDLKSANEALLDNYKLTLKEAKLKLPDIPVSGDAIDTLTKEPIIGSLIYNSKYDLWVVIKQAASILRNNFINALQLYLFIFLIVHLIVIWLVRRIHNNEAQSLNKLQYQAEHDPLTGLYNRYYLEKAFPKLLTEQTNDISLMFIDLDNFKYINDTFGHTTGDKLLLQVAERLKNFSSYAQYIIRFGGDEFVMVMQNKTHHDFDIAKQIIETIGVSYLIEDLNFTIGASIGIARAKENGCSLNNLLSHADLALYEAKNRKNWVEVFSENLQLKSQKTSTIEHNLRTALENDEIYLNYQPQVNKNGELHGVECLVRWQSPKLGFVPPNEFISIAEEIGFMPLLGQRIAYLALTEIGTLQEKLNRRFQISINVSIKQFMQENFFEGFISCVQKSRIPFKYITIEITESLLIEDIDFILSMLHQFRRKDIRISLDDFGTGYSSLSLLRQLPIQELKIDKAFVDDILDDSKDATLVKNIINIGNEFGMYTLAEGVEIKEQVEQLTNFECDLYQGYFFSKPLSIEDLETFITK